MVLFNFPFDLSQTLTVVSSVTNSSSHPIFGLSALNFLVSQAGDLMLTEAVLKRIIGCFYTSILTGYHRGLVPLLAPQGKTRDYAYMATVLSQHTAKLGSNSICFSPPRLALLAVPGATMYSVSFQNKQEGIGKGRGRLDTLGRLAHCPRGSGNSVHGNN